MILKPYYPNISTFTSIGDLHYPYVNEKMLDRAIKLSKAYSIKNLVIGGDLFDFSYFSQYPQNSPDNDHNLTNTLKELKPSLLRLFNAFTDVFICSGNHDERISKRLNAFLSLSNIVDMVLGEDRPHAVLHITDLDYLEFDNWLIVHPSSYSGVGGKLPSELADHYGKNVISYHNHCIGQSASKSGRYLGIDSGCMTNQEDHYYTIRRVNKLTKWQCGFVIVRNNFSQCYTENFTNWSNY